MRSATAGLGGWLGTVAIALGPAPAAAQLRLVPVDIRVPAPPVPVPSLDLVRLAYELRITNLSGRDLAVQELAVLDPSGAALLSWRGDSLRAAMVRVGAGAGAGDSRAIPGGRQAIAYLWVSVPPGRVPRAVSHRLRFAHPDSLDGPARDTVAGVVVPLRDLAPPVFQSPFEGGGLWLAANGPGNTSGHRRTAIPLDGVARIAQRFAIDWVKFGPDGRLFHGDSTRNENWYGYGVTLLAVAPGTVVDLKDGIPENVPLSPTRAVPVTLETVGGNYVILDLGGGQYAFYAHLQPGSVRVKVGDRVRAGQPLGLLGNSGNSDAPHLHLHLGDAPSPLGTEGLPAVFDQYRRMGRLAGFLAPLPAEWLSPSAGEVRRRETPLENDVIRFP